MKRWVFGGKPGSRDESSSWDRMAKRRWMLVRGKVTGGSTFASSFSSSQPDLECHVCLSTRTKHHTRRRELMLYSVPLQTMAYEINWAVPKISQHVAQGPSCYDAPPNSILETVFGGEGSEKRGPIIHFQWHKQPNVACCPRSSCWLFSSVAILSK